MELAFHVAQVSKRDVHQIVPSPLRVGRPLPKVLMKRDDHHGFLLKRAERTHLCFLRDLVNIVLVEYIVPFPLREELIHLSKDSDRSLV